MVFAVEFYGEGRRRQSIKGFSGCPSTRTSGRERVRAIVGYEGFSMGCGRAYRFPRNLFIVTELALKWWSIVTVGSLQMGWVNG